MEGIVAFSILQSLWTAVGTKQLLTFLSKCIIIKYINVELRQFADAVKRGEHWLQKKRRRKSGRHASVGAFSLLFLMIIIIICGIYGIVKILSPSPVPTAQVESVAETAAPTTEPPTEPPTEPTSPVSYPERSGDVIQLSDGIDSTHALLIDLDENRVIAEKSGNVVIYPASMTKLMTLIVAIEHIEDFNATFTMTDEILAPLYAAKASMAGFQTGEECTMMDLLYGAALPSGADATTALALHTAGSEEVFVQWMNEKVEELGLRNTHFTNASGLHDPNHYSTLMDIALILEYCLQDDLCRQIISTYTYTTRQTEQNPEGLVLFSTMFSRMYGTEVEGITIMGGKTGFTDEAGNCLASYARTPDGHTYIAVTSGGLTKWRPVFDAFKLYGVITGTYPMDVTDEYAAEETEFPAET